MTTEFPSADNAPRRDGSRLSEGLGELHPERAAFEDYFADSRRGKGPSRRPTFAKLADGTYADDSTQRHWWTWQQALAAERERLAAACWERRGHFASDAAARAFAELVRDGRA